MSRNPLDIVVQKALMTPKVVLSDLVLLLVVADTLQGDPYELNNQPKEYRLFVSDFRLYHIIIVGYALEFWFSNPHKLKHFNFKNDFWWHNKAIVILDVSFQGLNTRSFLF